MATQKTRQEIINALNACGGLSYNEWVNLLYSIPFLNELEGGEFDNFISRFTGTWNSTLAASGKYDIDYYAVLNNEIYKSTVNNNSTIPGSSGTWQLIGSGGSFFLGTADLTTDPGTPDENVIYIAEKGIYPLFDGVEITGDFGFLSWNGVDWSAINVNLDLSGLATKQEANLFTFFNNETLNKFFKELYIDVSDYTGTAITNLYCTLINRNIGGVPYAIVFRLNAPDGTEIMGLYADGNYNESDNIVTLSSVGGSGLKGEAVVDWEALTMGTGLLFEEPVKETAYQIKLNPVILSDGSQDKIITLNNDLATQFKNTKNGLLNASEFGYPENILDSIPSSGTKTVTAISTPNDFPLSNILLPQILRYAWTSDPDDKKFEFDVSKIKGSNGLTFSFWVRDSHLKSLDIMSMEYYASGWTLLKIPETVGYFSSNSEWNARLKLVSHIGDWKLLELKLDEDASYFYFRFTTSATTGTLDIANVSGVPDYDYVTSYIDVLYKSKDKGILSLINASNSIIFDGDSLTMGTNEGRYPDIAQSLIGSSKTIINTGVGGETADTILARSGSFSVKSPVDFVLPGNPVNKSIIADGTGVYLALGSYLQSLYDNNPVTPLLQMTPSYVNPVYINGVACTMSLVTKVGGNQSSPEDNTWYINRVESGSVDIVIKSGTAMYFSAQSQYRGLPRVAWIGTNGGYSDGTDLADKLSRYENYNNNNNVLYVGIHTSAYIAASDSNRDALELAMVKQFGGKYFNWRWYATNYALTDFNITPTAKDAAERTALGWDSRPVVYLTSYQIANNVPSDIYRMSIGLIPSSLCRRAFREASDPLNDTGALENSMDLGHLNHLGYTIVANKVIERLAELKFI